MQQALYAGSEELKSVWQKWRMRRTGHEAWSLISPIIAPHGGVNDDGKISLLDEAYVLVFSALNYWDEHHKENDHE